MKIKWTIVLIVILFSGCITSSYHKSNKEYGHVRREFVIEEVRRDKSNTKLKVFKGIWAGKRKIKGDIYHHIQFEGLLKGKGRYLDAMISLKGKLRPTYITGSDGHLKKTKKLVKSPGDVIFMESDKRISATRPAYLIFQVYSNLDQKAFYALFNQKVGQTSDPVAILKEHFKYEIKELQYPFALVKLDFSGTFKYTTRAIVWERGLHGKLVVSCVSSDIDKYDGTRIAIEWKERNKLLYGLRQGGYVGTVIADIVSSPVQLVMLILQALTGPV